MSCIALLDLIKAEELHSFMPSLVVMWYQSFVVKVRNLHGRPGTCVLRLLMFLLDSASTHQLWMTMKWTSWRSLWWPCTTGPAQLQVLTTRGLICLLGRRDHTKPFHQLDQLYFSPSSVLPTRQAAYGANQHIVLCHIYWEKWLKEVPEKFYSCIFGFSIAINIYFNTNIFQFRQVSQLLWQNMQLFCLEWWPYWKMAAILKFCVERVIF